MPERPEIRLDDNDVVAAAQILSWVARPHRPESGVDLLQHWYWRLFQIRGREVPELPFDLRARKRIEAQFKRLEIDCIAGFRAGMWLQWKILDHSECSWFANFSMSTRELSRRRAAAKHPAREEYRNPDNEIRDIWSRRKPIAHLALSAGNAIASWLAKRDLQGFGLSGAMLQPDWVAEAIEKSEDWFRPASRFIEPSQFVRFHRDTF